MQPCAHNTIEVMAGGHKERCASEGVEGNHILVTCIWMNWFNLDWKASGIPKKTSVGDLVLSARSESESLLTLSPQDNNSDHSLLLSFPTHMLCNQWDQAKGTDADAVKSSWFCGMRRSNVFSPPAVITSAWVVKDGWWRRLSVFVSFIRVRINRLAKPKIYLSEVRYLWAITRGLILNILLSPIIILFIG